MRDFARDSGQLAKTDQLDAHILARYGERMRPSLRQIPDETSRALVALVVRRRQLLGVKVAEENRLALALPLVAEAITRHLAFLRTELATLDRAIAAAIRDSPAFSERAALLRTVPGVGATLAATLVVELPELGTIDRKALAGLVRLAPYSVDSGAHRDYRRIMGGRADLRAALYMPTIAAVRVNPVIRHMYRRLKASGKAHLVAITACMRRLLVILNAVAKSGVVWQDRALPVGTLVPILS